MPLSVPVSPLQLWAFMAMSILFFLSLLRAFAGKTKEIGAKADPKSRVGIVLQTIGIGIAGFGPTHPSLPLISAASLLGTAAVIVFMGGAILIFVASSRALGRNWSIIARTRTDHELVRHGPYSHVRHPIYLGLMLFMFGLAAAFGHWLQLLIAVPLYVAGTLIRTRIEDRLLEESFGDRFREYREETPALLPKLL